FVFGVLGAGVAVGLLSAAWLNGVLLVVLLLSLYTLYNRVSRGLAQTR
ncbi:CDP-alcohol phosphatidyltransferase family protein, partial [Pseudomonas sp. MAFF212428]|nr:CDP-alcohol phosphatidyltransferase family protein [Pseudomonas brassicae]